MTKQTNETETLFDEIDGLTDTQRKILIAATEAFAEKGFASTSTNEIAKQAGVAEGTIFRYYKTKKDLLMSIVRPKLIKLIHPIFIKDMNKVLDQDYEQFAHFLKAMIHNRAVFLQKNSSVLRILFQELPFHPELKEQFIEHVGKKVYERLIQMVKHYQAKGQIRALPPETVIRVIASTIIGDLLTRYILLPELDWDEQVEVDRIVQFIMQGLSPVM